MVNLYRGRGGGGRQKRRQITIQIFVFYFNFEIHVLSNSVTALCPTIMPYDRQIDLAEAPTLGFDATVIAGTGSGKTKVAADGETGARKKVKA